MGRFSRAARQGDGCKGRCDIGLYTEHHSCDHKNWGTCQGSCNVFVEGIPAQKVGDSVIFGSCQHGGAGKLTEGSNSVFINGAAAARIKDAGECQNPMCSEEFVITQGASTVFFGD